MTTSPRAWPRFTARVSVILAAIVALTLLLACNSLLAGGSSTTETGDPVSLTGRVTTGGVPVAGVSVRLAKAGLTDTTDALGVYTVHGKLAKGAGRDTLVFTHSGIGIARRAVVSRTDSLPDVPVMRRVFSGTLPSAAIPHAVRVELAVRGEGIAAGDSARVIVLPDPVSGNYSAFLYFPAPAEGLRHYVAHVIVYGQAGGIIGRSEDLPFTNLTGDIAVPAFEVNLPATISGLRDTMVTAGTALAFSVTAIDPDGIARYLWDFNGDGVTDDSTLTGTVSHTFPAVSATHEVIVTIRDARGGLTRATARAFVLSAGLDWVRRVSPTSDPLNGVAWTGTQFVAVGANLALTSPDGVTWTARPVDPASTGNLGITSLTIHQGVLYAFAPGSIPNVFKSTDGITWTSHLGNFPFSVTRFSSAGGLLLAGGGGGAIYRSPDGIQWAIDTARGLEGGAKITVFTEHNGLIVGVGTYGSLVTSPDAINWTVVPRLGTGARYTLGAVVSTGTSVAAVGEASFAAVSGNGLDWVITQDLSPPFSISLDLGSMVWTGTALVAVGREYAMISPDRGLTWKWIHLPDSQGAPLDFGTIAWNGSRLVAVGPDGIATSP
jgi:hypothetical protein